MKTHGMRKTKEYQAWQHMIQRCKNKNHHAYKHYGGRGILVCNRWLKFENFLSDVGLAPSPKHSIDRYPNNNGNYEPGNVRWATLSQQAKNKRSVVLVEGKTMAEWSKLCGGNRSLVAKRVKDGWPLEKATSTPVNKSKQRTPKDQDDGPMPRIVEGL